MNDTTVTSERVTPWRQATAPVRGNGLPPDGRGHDVSQLQAPRASHRGRARVLVGAAVLAVALPFAGSPAYAQGYRPPVYTQPLNAPPPASPISPQGAAATRMGAQTVDQAAAYDQYMLDLSVANGQSSGPLPDGYFQNGAAVTSVPSAGQPGSAYFTNGAAVTSVPSAGQAGSGYFTNGAAATRLPLSAPSAQGAQPPSQAPDSRPASPAPTEPPAVSLAEPTAPPQPPVVPTRVDGPPMSFEAWIESMGAAVLPDGDESTASRTFNGEPLAFDEPYAAATGEGTRASYALPEKEGDRTVAREAARASRESRTARTLRLGAALIGASFAIGLLLGALGMWLARIRTVRARVATPRRPILR